MNVASRHHLVLALYPTTQGFSFALFEGPLSPYDWGVFEARGSAKNRRCIQRISQLFGKYCPDAVVLQDMSAAGTFRARRIRALNEAIELLADTQGYPVFSYSRAQVRQSFPPPATKQRIAEVIAKHIPAFQNLVPPTRRIWMSESPRMGLFDAAALAWRHYHAPQ